MSFTKILKDMNNLDKRIYYLDKQYMTRQSLKRKYRKKVHFQLNSFHHTTHNTMQKETKKHRYYADIQKDQVQDLKTYGYSTYQTLQYFKLNAKINRQTQINQKQNFNNDKQTLKSEKRAERRKCTGIRPDRTANSSNNYSHKSKQQQAIYVQQPVFLQQFSINQQQPAISLQQRVVSSQQRISYQQRVISQTYQQSQKYEAVVPSFPQNLFNFEKQRRRLNQQASSLRASQKLGKSMIKLYDKQVKGNKKKQINQNQWFVKQIQLKQLFKRKTYHLNQKAIQKGKIKFNKQIDRHMQFLSQTQSNKQNHSKARSTHRQIVYESEIPQQYYKQKIIQAQKIHLKYMNQKKYNFRNSLKIKMNQKQKVTKNYFLTNTQQYLKVLQIEQIISKLRQDNDLGNIHKGNAFLLDEPIIKTLKFDNKSTSNKFCTFQNDLIQALSDRLSFPTALSSINLHITNCNSLKTYIIQKVQIQLQYLSFKNKPFPILPLILYLLQQQIDSFIHLSITTQQQNKQKLLYQTFIHQRNTPYLQGLQIELHYLKYYLNRFFTFDKNVKKIQHIIMSTMLIIQSDISVPNQFIDFCHQLNIKRKTQIIELNSVNDFNNKNNHSNIKNHIKNVNNHLKNTNNHLNHANNDLHNQSQYENYQQSLLKQCKEINLSKILLNSSESLMLIKKQTFQGFDWRGVSLKNHQNYNKSPLAMVQNFYI